MLHITCCNNLNQNNFLNVPIEKSKTNKLEISVQSDTSKQDRVKQTAVKKKFKLTKGTLPNMNSGIPNTYSHPATLVGNWVEERQMLKHVDSSNVSVTKSEFAPIESEHYKKGRGFN